jgi:putative membrane protein
MKQNTLFHTLFLLAALGLAYPVSAAVSGKALTDATFAKKAAAGGLTEVELGKLAQQNGETQDVKDFGAKMVTDHGTINDNLKAIATKDSLTIPDKPTADQQALIDKLSKESGKTFDTAYIHAMVKAHVGDKALFTEEASSAKNPDLKQFATDSLKVITEHLSMIQEIAGAHGLAGYHKASSSTAMTMAPSTEASGDAAAGKSGAAADATSANPAPVASGPSGDMTTTPGTPSTGDPGQGKSGLAPGSNANPNAPAPPQ